ncbi:MAG: hypothetical protein R3Y50_04995 [Rikenellaceae bacterium]
MFFLSFSSKQRIVLTSVVFSISVLVSLPYSFAQNLKNEQSIPNPKQLVALTIAKMDGEVAAGEFVKESLPDYNSTNVYHMMYLPKNYKKGEKYPVIIELTGNKFPLTGSTGRCEDAHLGYCTTLGNDFIWAVAPYIAEGGKELQLNWWGDEKLTVDYLKKLVDHIVTDYDGDSNNVILCGFSRGSIGVSYIGLCDDEVAKLWRGFLSHDHFDGQKSWGKSWASDLESYRKEAAVRLKRLDGRQWYLSCNGRENDYREAIEDMRADKYGEFIYAPFSMEEYINIDGKIIPHAHNDLWPSYDIAPSTALREWIYRLVGLKVNY